MNAGKTLAGRKPKKHSRQKAPSLPVPASDSYIENDRFDEPSIPNRDAAGTRREDPDVCGLDNETIPDASDLH